MANKSKEETLKGHVMQHPTSHPRAGKFFCRLEVPGETLDSTEEFDTDHEAMSYLQAIIEQLHKGIVAKGNKLVDQGYTRHPAADRAGSTVSPEAVKFWQRRMERLARNK